MTELKELASALVDFQSSVPAIPKNRTAKIPTKNGGSYSYKYADLSDMWDAIRSPLKQNRLAVTQSLVGGSTGWTGIRTTVWHSSGQSFSETVEMQTNGRSPQEVGSQITYFKRYALGATLGIATEEDDDGNSATHAQQPEMVPAVAPQESIALLLSAVERAQETKEGAADWFRKKFKKEIKYGTAEELTQAAEHYTAVAVQKELAG